MMRSIAPLGSRSDALALSRAAVVTVFFLCGFTGSSWISRIPEVQVKLGLENGALGLALLSSTVGAVLAMPIAGVSVARFGSLPVSRTVALMLCFVLPLPALASSLPTLVLGLFCFGAAGGSLGVAMNAQAVLVEQRTARPIMSSFHAAFSAGGLCGAGLGSVLAGAGALPTVHLTAVALLSLGALAFVWRLLPSDGEHAERTPRLALRWPNRALIALGGLSLCGMLGEGAIADWSGVFLHRELHATAGIAAGGYAAFSFAMAGARAFGDWLALRLGAVRVLRLSGALAVLGLLIVLASHSPPLALLGFACVGAGFSAVIPTIFSAAGRLPGVSSAYALSVVTTLGYAGFLAGPPSIGFASEVLGLRGALTLVLGTSALIALLSRFATPRPS